MPNLPRVASVFAFDALADWIRRQGGVVHLEARDTATMGRGAAASRDLGDGHVVVSIPRALLVTQQLVRDAPIGQQLAAANVPFTDGLFTLAAFLLDARRAASAAAPRWAPYLVALPQVAPDVPAAFDDASLQHLAGVSVLPNVLANRALFRRQHARLIEAAPQLGDCDFAEFLWARTLVPSRAFGLFGGEALVPMGDMLNHAAVPDVTWGYEHPLESFVMRATRPIARGEIVRDSYGAKSNARLLELYGFCLDDPTYDEALLGFAASDATHPLHAGSMTLGRTLRGEQVFRVFGMPAREEAEAVSFVRRTLGGTAPLAVTDQRVAAAMRAACDRALAGFTTTDAADDAILASHHADDRARRCARVRAGERRVLAAVRARYAADT